MKRLSDIQGTYRNFLHNIQYWDLRKIQNLPLGKYILEYTCCSDSMFYFAQPFFHFLFLKSIKSEIVTGNDLNPNEYYTFRASVYWLANEFP